MSTINAAIDRVDELLFGPKEQKPSLRQKFSSILREYQQFYNELKNTGVMWSREDFKLTTSGVTEYLVSGAENAGRVLFVSAVNAGGNYPYAVEFAEYTDLTLGYEWFQPIVAARPEDYNGWGWGPIKVAFYRQNGDLYARFPSTYPSGTTLSITCSTGNWIDGIDVETSAVLRDHHALPEIRAAGNLLPGSEWTDDPKANQEMRINVASSLRQQHDRAEAAFVQSKRQMIASEITFRGTTDESW